MAKEMGRNRVSMFETAPSSDRKMIFLETIPPESK
jgi:hypothetical protein